MHKYLIVNADDYGMSLGINRGILEAHKHGIVTSVSLMVRGIATENAIEMANKNELYARNGQTHPLVRVQVLQGPPFFSLSDVVSARHHG